MKSKKMRIIVAGGRDFKHYGLMVEKLTEYLSDKDRNNIEIISGHARGADKLGERFAVEQGLKLKIFPADWEKYGKTAGFICNSEMGRYASQVEGVLFAFWDCKSKGTEHIIKTAESLGMETHIITY